MQYSASLVLSEGPLQLCRSKQEGSAVTLYGGRVTSRQRRGRAGSEQEGGSGSPEEEGAWGLVDAKTLEVFKHG